MTLIVGHNGRSRFSEKITNRTPESGGSIGGDKKAGTVYAGPSHFNINGKHMYLARAPKNAYLPIIVFTMNTTWRPVQRSGSSLVNVRGLM